MVVEEEEEEEEEARVWDKATRNMETRAAWTTALLDD
jgi:hypothetical protein